MKLKSKWKWIAAMAIAGWASLSAPNSAQAQDSTQHLRSAVTKFNDWMAGSDYAPYWRKTLDLGRLDTAAGRGAKANLANLMKVRDRFFQERQNPANPNFDSVRRALDFQIERIQQAEKKITELGLTEKSIDKWKSAFQSASESFRPMNSDELNRMRKDALTEARLLKSYVQWRGAIKFDPTVDPIRSFLVKHPEAKTLTLKKTGHQWELEFSVIDRLIKVLEKEVHLPWDKKAKSSVEYKISDAGTTAPSKPAIKQEKTSPADLYNELKNIKKEIQMYSRLDPTSYSLHTATMLDQYTSAMFLGQRANLPSVLKSQVQRRLIPNLDQWNGKGTTEGQSTVATVIGYLESANQCPDLVMAFKRTYWRQSTRIFISERLINRFATRPVNDTRQVNERILKNQVYGTATTTGSVAVDLLPNPNQATINLQLLGNIHSQNHSPIGPITVYTGSDGQMNAQRKVQVNFGGWYEENPFASVSLNSYFRGTSCGMIISRLAEGQFKKQQSQAEAIAARRAERRLLNQFSEETNQAFAEGRSKAKKSRAKLAPLMPYRPSIHLNTSDSFLRIYGSKAKGSQIPPLAAAPQLDIPCDVAVQIHQSLLINLIEDHFSAFSISSKQLNELTGQTPPADKPQEPFTLRLQQRRPIEVRFEDQMLRVAINIAKFTSKGQSINDLQVTVHFKMSFDNDGTPGIRLRQIGRVRAKSVKETGDFLRAAAMLDLIESTINEQLASVRQQNQERGIKLPMNLFPMDLSPELENLPNAGELRNAKLVVASFQDGWAELAWRLNDLPPGEGYPTRIRAIATEKQFKSKESQLNRPEEE